MGSLEFGVPSGVWRAGDTAEWAPVRSRRLWPGVREGGVNGSLRV